MTLRRRPKHADKGASLVIVLMVATVVATMMGVVLSQVDTSVRATVQLRDQAANNYGADAATQAILNGLQNLHIDCSGTSNPPVELGSAGAAFYTPTSGNNQLNAHAVCTPDAITGATTQIVQPPPVTSTTTVTPAPVTSTGTFLGSGDSTLPTYALLTTGTASGDFGIDISTSANNKVVCVENGSVGSDKNINATGETLALRIHGTGSASDCTTGSDTDASTGSKVVMNAVGTCTGTNGTNFKPTNCHPGQSVISAPATPSLSLTAVPVNPAPKCLTSGGNNYAAFVPGVYTTAANLNSPCGFGSNVFEWLSQGNYYFDFAGTTTWNWPSKMVAGTPITTGGAAVSGLNPQTASTLSNLSNTAPAPAACGDPADSSHTWNGVTLVMGGASTIHASTVSGEVCASSPTTTGPPPLAIYGLASSLTVPVTPSGTRTISAETLCSATTCGATTLIGTDPSAQASIYFKGYVYAVNAQVDISMKNSIGQLFNWGIVIRNFRLSVNGSSPTAPFVQLPKPNTGVGVAVSTSTPPPFPTTTVSTPPPSTQRTYTIRYINVWTCAFPTAPCPTTDGAGHQLQPNVQVRIKWDPASGTAIQVLSWAHIR